MNQPDFYALFRGFRHDLLNDLQLLLGHLQLERGPDVIEGDAERMIRRITSVSSLYACGDDALATLLWGWRTRLIKTGAVFSCRMEALPTPLLPDFFFALEQQGEALVGEREANPDEGFFLVKVHPEEFIFAFEVTPPPAYSIGAKLQEGWSLEKKADYWRYSYVYRSS